MLDIKFIRENADIVKAGAKKKCMDVDIDRLIAVDEKRRTLLTAVEEKKAKQNKVSEEVAKADEGARAGLIASMKELKEELQKEEEELRGVMEEWQSLMLQVPQIPDLSVPEGKSDEENVEIKTWGEKVQFPFAAKDHVEIMTALGMADFERGTKVHGFRGYYLIGDGARLSWAIWNYAQDFFTEKGFTPILPPTIVRKENLYGTGHLPNEAEDVYHTQDGDYLIGTSEVSVMGYYSGEVLSKEQLPMKFLGFSPCYRREAGSHGKDVKGLIRVHEFYKLEQIGRAHV